MSRTFTPLPDAGTPSFMEFVLERFLIDLRGRLEATLNEKVVVAYTTHTDYYDEERKRFVCDPPVLTKAAKAEVPAISLSDLNWAYNRSTFADSFNYVPSSFPGCDGSLVTEELGRKKSNPIEILDVSVTARLFEERPQNLIRLQRLLFQYLDVYPYLFIPLSGDREGTMDDCVLMDLKKQWFAYPRQELSVPGIFVKQRIPVDQRVFSSNLKASVDNLFVAETTIEIEDIPMPDGVDLGNFELFNAAEVTVFGVDQSFEEEQETAHSTINLGEFKECD